MMKKRLSAMALTLTLCLSPATVALATDGGVAGESMGFLEYFVRILPFAFVFCALVVLIVTAVMKSSLKSVRKQAAANSYVRSGSLNITDKRDQFLYSKVEKTPRKTDSGGTASGRG
jgi:hypothetical protein